MTVIREHLGELVFLLVASGLVAGFFLGRRKGRLRLSNMLADANATGRAEASTELRAQMTNSVHVTAGNVSGSDGAGGSVSRLDEAEIALFRRAMGLGVTGYEPGVLHAGGVNSDFGYVDLLSDVRDVHVSRGRVALPSGDGQRAGFVGDSGAARVRLVDGEA